MYGAYTHGLVPSYLEDSRLEQTSPTASWHTIWTLLQQPSGQHEDLSLDTERWPNHLLPSFPIPRWWHCLVPRNAMKELASGPQPVTPWVAWKWRLLAGYSALGMCASFSGQALAIPAGHRTSLFSFSTPRVPSQYSSKLCSEHGTEWETWEVTVGSFAWGQTWGLSLCFGGQKRLEHGSRNSRFIQPLTVGGHSQTPLPKGNVQFRDWLNSRSQYLINRDDSEGGWEPVWRCSWRINMSLNLDEVSVKE